MPPRERNKVLWQVNNHYYQYGDIRNGLLMKLRNNRLIGSRVLHNSHCDIILGPWLISTRMLPPYKRCLGDNTGMC